MIAATDDKIIRRPRVLALGFDVRVRRSAAGNLLIVLRSLPILSVLCADIVFLAREQHMLHSKRSRSSDDLVMGVIHHLEVCTAVVEALSASRAKS